MVEAEMTYKGVRIVRGEIRCAGCNADLSEVGAVIFEGFHLYGCKYECAVCGQKILTIKDTACCSRRQGEKWGY